MPVLDRDTPDTLAARVLEVEHRIYPRALALVAGGRAKVTGARVTSGGDEADAGALVWP